MEKDSLKRTRIHRHAGEGEQPCLVCGKPLEVSNGSQTPYWPTTEVKGGITGSFHSSDKFSKSYQEFVICDACTKDVAERAVSRDNIISSGELDMGTGIYTEVMEYLDSTGGIQDQIIMMMSITWQAGTGELPTGEEEFPI